MAGLRVLAAGSNASGQLANETLDDSHTLRSCLFACGHGSLQHQLPGDRVVSIASGANHALLLLERHAEGSEPQVQLWGCGDGRHGQLGPGFPRESAAQCKFSVFQRIDRDILDATDMDQGAYTLTSIAASWQSSYIVLQSQQGLRKNRKDIILSMGNNDFRDLGVELTESRSKTSRGPHRVSLEAAFEAYDVTGFQVLDIGAGTHHIIANIRLILEYGEKDVLVGWGACRHGQLSTDSSPPVKNHATTRPRIMFPAPTSSDVADNTVASFALGNYHSVLLHHSGYVTGCGSNKKGQIAGLQGEVGVRRVHCTWNGTYLVFENNSESRDWEIRAMGSYTKGQLGCTPVLSSPVAPRVVHFPFDHTTHRLLGVACGSEHVLALFEVDGGSTEVWGWGWNEHGNLGLGHTSDVHLPTKIWPEDAQGGRRILGVWAGCGTSWIVEYQ